MSVFIEDVQQSAKLRTLAPISQSTFSSADLVTIANEELRLKLVSDIMGVREDFFLTSKRVPLVANVDHYALPDRAIGNTLKTLFFVDQNGEPREIARVDVDRIADFGPNSGGTPEKFYFEGDEVVVLPKPKNDGGFLQFSFFAKPNRLIETAKCAKIRKITAGPEFTTFEVDTDLSERLFEGELIDFLCVKSPFLLWADGVPIVGVSATEFQVATAAVSNAAGVIEPQLGDYICPGGFANIPMIPEEFHPVLSQMMAVRLLSGLGDLNKWQAAKAELKEVRDEATRLIKNRVESSPRRMKNNSGLVRTNGRIR